jgi:hypothetical protein
VTDTNGNPLASQQVLFSTNGRQAIGPVADNGHGSYTASITSTPSDGTFNITATDKSNTPNIETTATLTQTGSNLFTLSRITPDKRHRTAVLDLNLPGPGTVTVTGEGLAPLAASARTAGTLALTIHPTCKLAKTLKTRSKATVILHITYKPSGGTPRTLTEPITLAESPARDIPH